MFPNAQNEYQQQVAINFQGEDNLSKVVDKISERITNFQTKVTVANIGLAGLKKVTGENVTVLEKFSKQLAITDTLLQKTFAATTFAKIGAVLTDGIKAATKELNGFSTGMKAFVASGYSTQIIDDFRAVEDAILGSREAVEQFSLQALTAFNRYKKAQTEVEVLFKQGDEFVVNLSKNIQSLVNNELKNAVTSIDALGAAYQAASALFLEANENTAVMTAGLKLAKAGGADASATMKVLTQTLRAYNMSAAESNKVAAVLNKTIQLGITSMPELANGFAQSAVTANAAKVKLEELAAAVAALTLQGFNTPAALTGLESLFRNIINKTPQAEAALRSLRDEAGKPIRFDISEIRAKGLATALDELNKAAKGNAEILATIIPEATAYNTALALMANNAQQLKDNSAAIFEVSETGKKAREALDEVFGIKISSQAEKFDAIINRITEQFIQFGEQLAPFFQVGVEALEKVIGVLSSISPEMKKIIAQWLIFQMGIGQVTNALGAVVGAATQAFLIFQGWRIMTGLFNGELSRQVKIVQELAKANIGLLPVIKQVIGIDQQHLLLGKEFNLQQMNRFQILGKLREQNASWLTQAKQLVGIDQSSLIVASNKTNASKQQLTILNRLTEQNKLYKETTTALSKVEKEYSEVLVKSKDAGKAIGESHQLLRDEKQKLIEIEKELNKVTVRSAEESYQLAEQYQQQQQKVAQSEAQLFVNKQNRLDLETKAAKLQEDIATKSAKAEEIAQRVKVNSLKVQKAQVAAEELQKKAVEARTLADLAASQAAKAKALADAAGGTNAALNAAAETALANATTLQTAAENANTVATQANNTARKLATTLATEQALAEGRLIKVKTLVGEQTVKNTLLNRIFFQDFKTNWTQLTAQLKNQDWKKFLTTPLFDFKGAIKGAGGLLTIFKGIGATLAGIGAKLLMFAPILVPLAAVGAVLYDQFAGTSAQVRKMGESLENTNKELDQSRLKTLRDLEEKKKLTGELKRQLIGLEAINEVQKLNGFEGSELKGVWDGITDAIGNAWKGITNFYNDANLLGIKFKDIVDGTFTVLTLGLGKLFQAIRYDQYISTFAEIEKQIEKTSAATLNFAETNKKLKQGFTELETVNKKIREGKQLEPEDITKLKNQAEARIKVVDLEISANDKRIEALKEKLKDYDAMKEEDKERASDQDKQLARERDVLEAQNENLKKQRQNYADNQKALEEYVVQRNILLKRIEDSNPQVDKEKDILPEDFEGQVGEKVNALQVRFRRSVRQSEEDLQEYAKKVEATINGTGEYVNAAGKKVKLDVTQMGQFVQDFDRKVETTVAGIGQLYEGNYISAKEANEKLQKVLDEYIEGTNVQIKDRLSKEQLQQYYAQIIEYSKNASKQQIELLQKESETQQQLANAGVTSQLQTSQAIRKIQQQQLQAQIADLEKTLKLQLDIAPALKKELEAQLGLLNAQLQATQVEDQRKSIDERYQQQQVALDKEVASFKLARSKFVASEEETTTKLEQAQKKQLLQQQARLQEQLKLVGNDKEQRIKLETEILNVQLEYQQVVTTSLQRELDKRNKQITNSTEKQKVQYQKVIQTLNSTNGSLQEELKIIEARNKAAIAANEFESSRLQNQLRVTADIEKRADIELQIATIKNKNSEIALQQEQQSLQYQQKLIDLGLQRQQLELNISKIQNEAERKLLENELKRAEQQKLRKEEVDAIQIKLEANKLENKVLNDKQQLLTEQKKNQIEINKFAQQELQYKEEITKEGGKLDVELAKQNKILATYEKQAQVAKADAQLAEIAAAKQISQIDLIQKSLENRVQLAQKQLELEQQQQDNTQRMFKMAGDLAATDYQKQQLAKLAARQELDSLNKKQEIEKKLLEMQIRSNDLAFERQKREQKAAELRLAAELKVQEAETRKVLANKMATDEDKKIALAQLEAKQFTYQNKLQERGLLAEQEQLNQYNNEIQRYQLQQRQSNERQDKAVAYAKTTFGMSDDMAIYRAIKQNLAPVIADVTSNIKNNPLNYNTIFSTSNAPLPVAPKLSFDTVSSNNIVPLTNATSTTSNDKQVVINFTNTNDVTIEGNANKDDVTKGIKDANEDAITKLYDIFRQTNVELGNR